MMPEKLFAWVSVGTDSIVTTSGYPRWWPTHKDGSTEYIRKDVADAEIEKWREWTLESRNELNPALAQVRRLESEKAELLEVLEAVKACPLMLDEKGHQYIKVDARSINGTGALVYAAIAKARGENVQKVQDTNPLMDALETSVANARANNERRKNQL